MKSALEAESKFTENERMMYYNDMREKAIRDYYSGLDEAKEEGIAIGAEQTSKKKDAETVKRLLMAGMDNTFIKNIVPSYTDEAIDSIRKELAES